MFSSKSQFILLSMTVCLATVGCSRSNEKKGSTQSPQAGSISAERLADSIHAVVMADRSIYATHVVTNLQEQNSAVQPSEYWETEEHKVPLPAQMLRMGSELVNKNSGNGFTYNLKSKWPLNRQNRPGTDVEVKGLEFIINNEGKNFYSEEVINEVRYLIAVYPDRAVTKACWDCHNNHPERADDYPEFKEGDVMGGVIVRIVLP